MYNSTDGTVMIQDKGSFYDVVFHNTDGIEVNHLTGSGEPPTADKMSSMLNGKFSDVLTSVEVELSTAYQQSQYRH